MSTQTAKFPVPPQGDNPQFDDAFFEWRSHNSDFIDEERSNMRELLSHYMDGECDPQTAYRDWRRQRFEEYREMAWEEWQDQFVDPWEALNEERAENETLRTENGTPKQWAAEKDGRIRRLRKHVRQLKKDNEANHNALCVAKDELEIEKDVTAHYQEVRRRRNCGYLPEVND